MIMQVLNQTYRQCKFRWRRQWEPDENGSKQHEVETEQHRDLHDEDQDAVMLSTPSSMNPILLLLLLLLNFPPTTASLFVTLRIEMIQILCGSWDATKKRYNCKMELHDLRATAQGRNEMNAKFNRTSLHCGPPRPTANCHLHPMFFLIYTYSPFSYCILSIFRITANFILEFVCINCKNSEFLLVLCVK